jgi:hypothetical protein
MVATNPSALITLSLGIYFPDKKAVSCLLAPGSCLLCVRTEEAKRRRAAIDREEEDLAARQDALLEAEETHATQRSLLGALESKTLGREAKATQMERALVLRERELADMQTDIDAQRREVEVERQAAVSSRTIAGVAAVQQRKMDEELAALGEWERSHAEQSRAALAELESEMAV